MAPDCFCWTSVPGVVVILFISYMEELAVIPVSVHKKTNVAVMFLLKWKRSSVRLE